MGKWLAMTQYFAFLRAINVGGHTVKMGALKQLFEGFGFSQVETFIGSGNVIFETDQGSVHELENRIEAALVEPLGFKSAVFLRTFEELVQITACQPFPEDHFSQATAFNVAFLKVPPDEAASSRLLALQNEIDAFAVVGREVYWLCQVRQSESKFANTVLEKVLGQPATMRQVSTMQRLVEKYKEG